MEAFIGWLIMLCLIGITFIVYQIGIKRQQDEMIRLKKELMVKADMLDLGHHHIEERIEKEMRLVQKKMTHLHLGMSLVAMKLDIPWIPDMTMSEEDASAEFIVQQQPHN